MQHFIAGNLYGKGWKTAIMVRAELKKGYVGS